MNNVGLEINTANTGALKFWGKKKNLECFSLLKRQKKCYF